uniref:RNA (guanine-9-)-methyltransferase domain-containing protein 1 n=1 Tax=Haemonchus contortus TaxID=6289 RepID=A0A7I4YSQ1_HAECO
MKWLENIYYRAAWKFRRVFRLDSQTIAPIQWHEPLLKTFPERTLDERLDESQKQRLRDIVEEVRTISMLTKHFPSQIKSEDWLVLLECHTRKQRLDHLKFLRNRELEREKDLLKKRLKTPLPPREKQEESDHVLYFPHTKLAKDQRSMAWQKVARAHRCGEPSLVVDCRFLPLLSPRGAELTAIQLKYMISENRDDRAPWQLYFTSFDYSSERIRRLKDRHLSVIASPSTCSPIISPQSFTDLFERDRIVYLSPDADEEIEDVKQSDVYVLGGIVDRVAEKGIPRQASLETAVSEGVRCKKLPLDKYVKWKSGTKFLTLTAVSTILRDVYSSGGDWEFALRKNIPVRNIRSVEEKSIGGRILHNKIRQFDRQLLQIVERELGEEVVRERN